ncbi:acyl-CoA dehydrogenase family protein [Mycobacterium sp. CVI_P3]|uniref:Acyl-CoA dehydrogenase family protein n=1 Tax=Mycobacterium pinniadriaticum TaxID=2994102 RepID=A0ABT3SAD9_9MYCO|nr:acyl-CoA dehydrogenase family protein [Mycobacterium pinniadriaticum]MCX2929898.1 acyl-CoA dehydrogenase family protein [Mycobacterium pinniadriaticum]MCX2936453.1 acyl-CoA dehydrogenase family protein [Mycobacterium pinniadriaticum]
MTLETSLFATRCRNFLDRHAERIDEAGSVSADASDEIPVFDSPEPHEEQVQLAAAREWQRELFDAGLAWITGPPEYGGAGLDDEHQLLFEEMCAEYRLPKLDTVFVTLHIVLPGIVASASEELKRRLVPSMLRGDTIACQLFSEPGAGSDLSAVSTRAVPVESTGTGSGEWVASGQKVWTTGGHYSDVGLLLARTGDDPKPHRRLTMFVVDMHDPAIEVRPLREMSGGAHFNEVFIDNLRISDDRRVGEVNGGWRVAMATLGGERKAVGYSRDAPNWVVVLRLVELTRKAALQGPVDPSVVDAVVDCYVLGSVIERTAASLSAAERRGELIGPEMSTLKLLRNRLLSKCMDTARHVLGMNMLADSGEWGTYAWGYASTLAPGLRIGGGTDEIQRNVIGERVLGLPRGR